MRKILLGTTAVVGAALLTPAVASAQEAPTVRLGGYFQAYYGNTQQTGMSATNVSMNNIGTDASSAAGNTQQSARLGKNDFSSDAEVHVFINGKAANGLSYGAVIEMAFNQQEGTDRPGGRRTTNEKTTGYIDEFYAFISSPTLGQIRFGDEDGPMGGLMNAGYVTNFGSGGVYGYWENFTVRPNRTTTSPGALGDNTKIIYLSPQVFGFDLGVSYAPNEGSGEDTGCINGFASVMCDRAYALTNNTGSYAFREGAARGRLNELQAMLRWRGNIAGVGIAASIGTLQSGVTRNIDLSGNIQKNLRSPQIYQAGLQATYLGFTLGVNYTRANTTLFYIPTPRGGKDMEQWFVGGSYTMGPITIGSNAFWGSYGQLAGTPVTNAAGQLIGPDPTGQRSNRRWGVSVGANYRLAPGMDILAEWTHHETKTPGVSQQGLGACGPTQVNNCADRARANIFLTGVRLAF